MMMRTLLFLLLLPSLAFGLEIIITIDGKETRRIAVDSSADRIVVDVRTVPSKPDPKPPIAPPKPPPPQPSACGPRPQNVTIVTTGAMTQRYNKKTYAPKPTTIVAFAFTTPVTGDHRGRATSTVTTVSPQAKLLSISECPGDYKNPIKRSNACVQTGIEVAQVVFSTDPDAGRFECVLERGRTYYINASSHVRFDREDFSCATTNECSYTFMRDPS